MAARDLAKTYKPVPKDFEQRISKELKTVMEFPGYTADKMADFKERYAAIGAEPAYTRYGWVRTRI